MSLEQKLQQCTEALIALTAALNRTAAPTVIAPAGKRVAEPAPEPELDFEAKVDQEPPPAPAPAPAPVPAAPTIDYAQVANAITTVFKTDRAKVINALAKFGAAKGPQLKVADYAEFLKELA